MATLSQNQIRLYAAAAGFSNPSLMAAIAMAESSGNATVVNSIGCVGLWQINQPVWVKSHPTWTKAWLMDPMHNATAAKVIYDAQGLNAWEAYTNGAYSRYYNGVVPTTAQDASIIGGLKNLVPGTADLAGQLNVPGASTVADTASAISSASKAVWAAGKWVSTPFNWLRIAFVLGGGIVTVVAINMTIEGTLLGKVTSSGASDAVTNVIPGGGYVKKALAAKGKSAAAATKTAATKVAKS